MYCGNALPTTEEPFHLRSTALTIHCVGATYARNHAVRGTHR